jgi:hypothetical protein
MIGRTLLPQILIVIHSCLYSLVIAEPKVLATLAKDEKGVEVRVSELN